MGSKPRAVLGIAVLVGILVISGCGKGPTTPEPPTPTFVNLSFTIYNHTQGVKATFSRNSVQSGNQVTLNVQNLLTIYSITGVDTQRIVLRLKDFGQLVKFSNSGELVFTAPSANTEYDVYLFNALVPNIFGDAVSYSWMDDKNARLYSNTNRPVVYRQDFDGQTGEERIWGGEALPEIGGNPGVFDQLIAALQMPGVSFKFGQITRLPSSSSGTFSYGYGNSDGADGYHLGYRITVNWAKLSPSIGAGVAIGLEEAFENICCVDNIGGRPSSVTIQNLGILNQNGKDLFAYVFVKDQNAVKVTGARQ